MTRQYCGRAAAHHAFETGPAGKMAAREFDPLVKVHPAQQHTLFVIFVRIARANNCALVTGLLAFCRAFLGRLNAQHVILAAARHITQFNLYASLAILTPAANAPMSRRRRSGPSETVRKAGVRQRHPA